MWLVLLYINKDIFLVACYLIRCNEIIYMCYTVCMYIFHQGYNKSKVFKSGSQIDSSCVCFLVGIKQHIWKHNDLDG